MKSKRQPKLAYAAYTGIFIVLVAAMYGIFILTGKSFIWQGDGLAQHYPILVRFYDWLHQGKLAGWSWNLGLGADRITAFSYYVLGDPISYLIGLFPKQHIETGYNLLVLVRLYLSGLAFMFFARQRMFKPSSRLIGTITYTFTGFSLYVSIRHPFFLLPMILFPLLAYGIDHVLAGKSWLPLAAFTGLTLIGNFYFAYILAIGSLVYAILRYFAVRHDHVFHLGRLIGRLIGAGLVGALLGSILFIPSALGVLKSTRAGTDFANGYLLYPFNYYLKIPNAVVTTGNAMSFWVNLGLAGLTFLALVYTLSHFKRYLWLNLGVVLLGVGLLFPEIAAIMNGGTTPSQRWLLLGCLAFGLAVMSFCDQLVALTHCDLLVLVWATLGLLLLVWTANGFIMDNDAHDFVLYGWLLLTLGAIVLGVMEHWSAKRQVTVLMGLLCLNVVANSYGYFSPLSGGASQQLTPRGVATKFQKDYYDGAEKYVKHQAGFSRSRISRQYYYSNDAKTNLGMNLGAHDIMSYFSVENGDVGVFSQALGNAQFKMNKPINQGDSRTTLNNLLGVRYVFARENQPGMQAFPYGYHVAKKNGKAVTYADKPVHGFGNSYGTTILTSKYALPLAYLQTQKLSAKQFKHLSDTDREQALTTGALYEAAAPKVKTTTYHSRQRELSYKVRPLKETVINSFKQLVNYRQQGNQLDPDLVKTSQQSLRKHNQDRSVSINEDRTRLGKLIKQNQKILKQGKQKNKHGLTRMTSDNQNHPITYQLRIKQPQRTRGTELYLDLSGIKAERFTVQDKYQGRRNTEIFQNRAYTGLSRLQTLRKSIWNLSDGAYSVTATSFQNVNSFNQLGQTNLSDYEPKSHVLLNLGYSTSPRRKIKLTFKGVKSLSFKSAKLIAVPFGKPYAKQMRTLQHQGLSNLNVTSDRVTGTAQADTASILTTSIPYSSGWRLTVDGKPQATHRVNVGFIGASLPAGQHKIELTHRTPGLRLGIVATALGLLIMVLSAIWTGLKRRKRP